MDEISVGLERPDILERMVGMKEATLWLRNQTYLQCQWIELSRYHGPGRSDIDQTALQELAVMPGQFEAEPRVRHSGRAKAKAANMSMSQYA